MALLVKMRTILKYWSTSIADLGMRIAELSNSFLNSSLYFQSEIRDPQSEML
jgi:hypothetical protein